jgi:hypothetical protein
MGLGYAWSQITKGNFANAFNGIWSDDSLLAAQDSETDNLSKLIQQHYANGLISSEEAQNEYAHLSPATSSDLYWSQNGDTPLQVFNNTLVDEAKSVGQFGSSAINKTLGLGLKLIPWQVYVLAFALLLIWLYPIWRPFAARLFPAK